MTGNDDKKEYFPEEPEYLRQDYDESVESLVNQETSANKVDQAVDSADKEFHKREEELPNIPDENMITDGDYIYPKWTNKKDVLEWKNFNNKYFSSLYLYDGVKKLSQNDHIDCEFCKQRDDKKSKAEFSGKFYDYDNLCKEHYKDWLKTDIYIEMRQENLAQFNYPQQTENEVSSSYSKKEVRNNKYRYPEHIKKQDILEWSEIGGTYYALLYIEQGVRQLGIDDEAVCDYCIKLNKENVKAEFNGNFKGLHNLCREHYKKWLNPNIKNNDKSDKLIEQHESGRNKNVADHDTEDKPKSEQNQKPSKPAPDINLTKEEKEELRINSDSTPTFVQPDEEEQPDDEDKNLKYKTGSERQAKTESQKQQLKSVASIIILVFITVIIVIYYYMDAKRQTEELYKDDDSKIDLDSGRKINRNISADDILHLKTPQYDDEKPVINVPVVKSEIPVLSDKKVDIKKNKSTVVSNNTAKNKKKKRNKKVKTVLSDKPEEKSKKYLPGVSVIDSTSKKTKKAASNKTEVLLNNIHIIPYNSVLRSTLKVSFYPGVTDLKENLVAENIKRKKLNDFKFPKGSKFYGKGKIDGSFLKINFHTLIIGSEKYKINARAEYVKNIGIAMNKQNTQDSSIKKGVKKFLKASADGLTNYIPLGDALQQGGEEILGQGTEEAIEAAENKEIFSPIEPSKRFNIKFLDNKIIELEN